MVSIALVDARKTSLTGVQNSKKNRLAALRLVDDAPHRRWVKPPPPPWKKARSAPDSMDYHDAKYVIVYKYIIPERLWLNLWALRFLPLYYFLRGAAPKKIVGSGRNRRPIDSTGASKKGMIYLFYIPHQQHLWKLPVTFTFLCWSLSS